MQQKSGADLNDLLLTDIPQESVLDDIKSIFGRHFLCREY
jgi:hypothetical protein